MIFEDASMKIQRVMRWDPVAKLLRLGRLIYDRGTVGDGKGYSAKLSLALTSRLLRFRREFRGWIVTVLGVRVHYCRSYGGRFA